jgi:hypothetical protein
MHAYGEIITGIEAFSFPRLLDNLESSPASSKQHTASQREGHKWEAVTFRSRERIYGDIVTMQRKDIS